MNGAIDRANASVNVSSDFADCVLVVVIVDLQVLRWMARADEQLREREKMQSRKCA